MHVCVCVCVCIVCICVCVCACAHACVRACVCCIYIYDLVPKGAQMGSRIFTVNKIHLKHFVLLLLCVCLHNWSVSQWKQYELQIWSSWKNIIFWKWKAPRNSTPENGHAHGEYFQCFHSRTWWIKTLPQSPICTEEISLYTVHIKSIISLSFVFGVRGTEIFLGRTLCVLKCFMTSIGRQCSEERTFSFVETLLQSLWYVTALGANVLFYCQMSG